MIISRGVQSCTNTKGVHVWAIGKPGQGKSEGEVIMVELSPNDRILDANISPKVLYYKQETMLPATTVCIDDITLNGELASLFKKMTTKFQKGAGHTVVIEGEPLDLRMSPRAAIWTSSVDTQGDEQSRDRFVFIPIDEKQTDAIIKFMKDKDKKPQDDGERDFETAVCQGLLADLASKTFFVEIPFTDDFEFPMAEETRGYGIFADFIKGLAALRYAKREVNKQGHLLADTQDFYDAKTLYEGLQGHSVMKFTTSEQEVLQALIALDRKASLDQIVKATGKSEPRVKEIMNGRTKNEQRRHGLLYKCPSLTATLENVTQIGTKVGERKSHRENVYTLDPAFNLMDGRAELIPVTKDSLLDKARPTTNIQVKPDEPIKPEEPEKIDIQNETLYACRVCLRPTLTVSQMHHEGYCNQCVSLIKHAEEFAILGNVPINTDTFSKFLNDKCGWNDQFAPEYMSRILAEAGVTINLPPPAPKQSSLSPKPCINCVTPEISNIEPCHQLKLHIKEFTSGARMVDALGARLPESVALPKFLRQKKVAAERFNSECVKTAFHEMAYA